MRHVSVEGRLKVTHCETTWYIDPTESQVCWVCGGEARPTEAGEMEAESPNTGGCVVWPSSITYD